MAVAGVSKITAASPTSFDAAVQEGLTRAGKTLRGITGLHVIEQEASVFLALKECILHPVACRGLPAQKAGIGQSEFSVTSPYRFELDY